MCPGGVEVPELLQDWVTRHAEIRPDALAVAGAGEALTYARLEELSSRLVGALRVAGCKKGDRVCLLMPKSATAIACIVGIYKTDCVYVPLDTSCPSSRLTMSGSGNQFPSAGSTQSQ
ncbi:MAG: hypothetical protein DMG09_15885 [Acidobacteria bacterium]|nr:MAG: hypothetical protein DMG09_15885 [Acidobacteriota bacterium]